MSVKHVTIIAEAGVNHNGNLENAKKLVDVASEAGADFVKFQTFIAEKSISKLAAKAEYQIINAGAKETQLEMVKKLELSEYDHDQLIAYCSEKNIKFLSTPFDFQSIELLAAKGIRIGKIPSGEITNLPYLQAMAKTFSSFVLSTGMATLNEIEAAVNVLYKHGVHEKNLTVLHCNTEYPTPMQDVNLSAMQYLKEKLNVEIGYSDHTLGIEVPIAAVALGATVIEKHFTLDRNMEGPDHRASLEPSELKAMVAAIRNIEQAIGGSGIKEPSPSELKNIAIARKSVHTSKALPAGHVLNATDLIMKRPGTGISPMQLENILGKKTKSALEEDHLLSMDDLV